MRGVIPKDSEKKEMLSFIAYAINLENTCKLSTQSKQINLNDDNDKNRIYLSGNALMSSKLPVGKVHKEKACLELANTAISCT